MYPENSLWAYRDSQTRLADTGRKVHKRWRPTLPSARAIQLHDAPSPAPPLVTLLPTKVAHCPRESRIDRKVALRSAQHKGTLVPQPHRELRRSLGYFVNQLLLRRSKAAQASGARDALLSLAQDLKKLARYEKKWKRHPAP